MTADPAPTTILETERLRLRRFTGDDLDNLVALHRDPEVMRFVDTGNPVPPQEVRAELPLLIREYEEFPGFGRWAAIEKDTDEFVGWFGLRRREAIGPANATLGYRIHKRFWGRGYATEACRALVRRAFAELGVQRISADAMAVNHRSRRVMDKAGLTYVRTYYLTFSDPIPGTEQGEVEYAITKAEWQHQEQSPTTEDPAQHQPTDHPLPLAEGWDSHALEWIAWTRTGLDSYQSHREAFMPLIPSPSHLTVDIGCGEGRVSRELQALGHRVLAIDRSLAMSRSAAAHPVDPVPAIVADAAELPLATGTADCAVAFMSLHDIDHMPAAVREIARILSIGGHLVMAIVHPINSAGHFPGDKDDATRPFVIDESYTQPKRYVTTRAREGLTMTYHGEHRPLHAYTEALADAGFVIDRLREQTSADPRDKWHRIPLFLHILATLQQPKDR